MRQYLQAEDEIGKKMDFLVQEMNRETNTIGSKASDVAITQWVVELKSEIEKLREQIQKKILPACLLILTLTLRNSAIR